MENGLRTFSLDHSIFANKDNIGYSYTLESSTKENPSVGFAWIRTPEDIEKICIKWSNTPIITDSHGNMYSGDDFLELVSLAAQRFDMLGVIIC